MKQKRATRQRAHAPPKHTSLHHRQKKRPIHKRIALHPVSVMVLFIFGLFLVGNSIKSYADSYIVSAIVPAPALTQPAVIMYPSDQSHFSSSSLIVTGTCPDNSYVKLSDNSIFVGVANCDQNSFSITIDLSASLNQLVAQDYNLTDMPGPSSNPVNVYYDVPSSPTVPSLPTTPTTSPTQSPTSTKTSSSSTHSSSPSTTVSTPFFITSSYHYQVYMVGQTINLSLTIGGGSAPYGVTVLWGDGNVLTAVRGASGTFTVSHSYSSSGPSNTDEVIQVEAIDSKGTTAHLQTMVILRAQALPIGATSASGPTNPIFRFFDTIRKWLWLIWPAYIIVTLNVISFWFGEHELYRRLKLKQKSLRPSSARRR